MTRLDGRIALVTGASRGIGRAVAVEFAREGAHVIALARTTGALEELDDEIKALGATATLVPLDLADHAAIDRLGGAIHERYGRLDTLVGNAALLGSLTPVGHIDPGEWQDVIAVNVTANGRLIRAFDPLLRAAEAGRAIFTTSASAWLNTPFWGTYAASKAALDSLVRTYAAEMANTPVRVNLVAPGPTATAMRIKAMPGEDPASLTRPQDIAPLFVELAERSCERNGEIVDYREWRAAR